MRYVSRFLGVCFFGICVLIFSGCSASLQENITTLLSPDETYEKADSYSSGSIVDNKSLYKDMETEVVTMYLTLGYGNEEEGTDHTWSEINRYPLTYYEENELSPYQCEAILQVGDEIGPLKGEFGYGVLTPNATVRLRGTGASEQPQKSYRIDIKKGKGEWEDQKAVVLNKHSSDPTRFRNKLAYDLMAEIPEMFSARTWFVHLYVKDKTEGEDGLYEDYGLYTAVEQINGRYLSKRNLDSGGQMYKAVNFDWNQHEDVLKPATSVDFDQAAFEEYLEIKGDVDNSKLLSMLKAVNDSTTPIGKVLDEYFDRKNLFYWMAFHILMGNRSVEYTNYYLYSPQAMNKWYILSWDNDGMLSDTYESMRDESYSSSWNHGIFTFVSGRLYSRMMRDSQCREELDEAVEDLYSNYLNVDNINGKAELYRSLIEEYVYSMPDQMYQRVSQSDFDSLTESLFDEIEDNYESYKASLEEPWPFHILAPEKNGRKLRLNWEEAFCYEGTDTIYSVELSENPSFSECLVDEGRYTGTDYEIDMLPAGQYFLRVRAGNGAGSWQDAYEFYWTETDTTVYSTMCFYVLSDGSVAVNEYYGE